MRQGVSVPCTGRKLRLREIISSAQASLQSVWTWPYHSEVEVLGYIYWVGCPSRASHVPGEATALVEVLGSVCSEPHSGLGWGGFVCMGPGLGSRRVASSRPSLSQAAPAALSWIFHCYHGCFEAFPPNVHTVNFLPLCRGSLFCLDE